MCYSHPYPPDEFGISLSNHFQPSDPSGPELALNMINIWQPSSIGVGAVVGGEVFNVLVIIGTAVLATPDEYMPLKLSKLSFSRDRVWVRKMRLPSGYVKIAIENGLFISWIYPLIAWWFSIVMLNYQRVFNVKQSNGKGPHFCLPFWSVKQSTYGWFMIALPTLSGIYIIVWQFWWENEDRPWNFWEYVGCHFWDKPN